MVSQHASFLDYSKLGDPVVAERERRYSATRSAWDELGRFINGKFAAEADHDPLTCFLFKAMYPELSDAGSMPELPPGVGGTDQLLRGWRQFRVGIDLDREFVRRGRTEPTLVGVLGYPWKRGPQRASCHNYEDYNGNDRHLLAVMHLGAGVDGCGLYGTWEYNHLHTGLHAFSVVTSVVGWGISVLAERGFRCEEMEIERLWIVDQMTPRQRQEMYSGLYTRHGLADSRELANMLGSYYGVPCSVGTHDGKEPPCHNAALTIANEAHCDCGSTDVGTASILFGDVVWVIGCSCGRCGKHWAKEADSMASLVDGPPVRPVRSMTHWGDGFRLE